MEEEDNKTCEITSKQINYYFKIVMQMKIQNSSNFLKKNCK